MAYNKITLHGSQTCDYIYIQDTAPEGDSFSFVNDEPSIWSENTKLYANFKDPNRRLSAGDSAIVGNIDGYEVYRKKYNEAHSEYIGTVKKSEDTSGETNALNDLIVDYAAKNGVDYTYYLYPNIEKSKGGTVLSPFITKQLAINCPYWCLLIVDETEEDNVFYLDKMFKFELNLEVNNMSNNAQVSIQQNFTKYPTVQYGAANYWSGSLSSLCGFIASNQIDYVQNVNMIEEIKSISSDVRRKFLKDTEGNLWEVNVAAPINVATEYMATEAVKTWTFSWVEVGDASNVSIISNPYKPITDWVLTETGEAVPYFTYVWDEQYKWDNSYLWTANDNVVNSNNINLGRNIKK